MRDGQLDRLTTDHCLVEELVRQGRLTPQQAEAEPRSSIITRALGPEPEVDVDTFTCAARDGDVYLICSDGLTGMLPERELADVLRSATSLDAGARELVRRANQHGGRDNITVVLFRLGAEPPAADDPDTLSGAVTETAVDAQRVRAAVAAAESDTLAGAPASAPQAARSSRGEAATVIPASAPRTTAAHPRPGHSARADDAAERRRRRALAAVALVMLIAALAVALVLTGGRL